MWQQVFLETSPMHYTVYSYWIHIIPVQTSSSPVTKKKMLHWVCTQPSKLVLVMITLSIGVSRVFVPQREADVNRSGTWRCRERPHKGNKKATAWVYACVIKPVKRIITYFLQQGSGSHQVMSRKNEATSGQSHRSAGVSLENQSIKILLNV